MMIVYFYSEYFLLSHLLSNKISHYINTIDENIKTEYQSNSYILLCCTDPIIA